MSSRTKSVPKPKRAFHSPKKQFETLCSSIKKYEAKFKNLQNTKTINSPSSSSLKGSTRDKKRGGFRSQQSPHHILKTEYNYDYMCKSSETSVDTFEKSSEVDEEGESLYERNSHSPILNNIKKHYPDSVEYENELLMRRHENIELKSKLDLLLDRSHASKRKEITNYSKELKSELQSQQRNLKERYKAAMRQQKEELVEEFHKELELAKQEIARKLKMKHKQLWSEREVEIKENFRREILNLQNEHEDKLKDKITEIAGEFERELNRVNEEVIWLRKQNENLKKQLEESNNRVDTAKSSNKTEGLITNSTIDQTRELNEIYRAYSQLQQDYSDLKSKKKINTLCSKCKAFTITNSELSGKISRIRAYIDSHGNL